jgi:23S rRNA (uracil1939-C5)-methyltransferase
MKFENITIEKAVNEGKCLTRIDNMVVFTQRTVPGDVVDLEYNKKKKNYADAQVTAFHSRGESYSPPFCPHFDYCSGCKWQQMQYPAQLVLKQNSVQEALLNIGKVELPQINPIIGSPNITYYRNKMEYSFTHKKWVPNLEQLDTEEHNALGLHVAGRFDKVLDIVDCHLQDDLGNNIRNFVRDFAIKNNYTFFDLRDQHGMLRNIILRNNTAGEWMLILMFIEDDAEAIKTMMEALKEQFPQIKCLLYVINAKRNDTITDLPVHTYWGDHFLMESLGSLHFKISPKAFFQVNVPQAKVLYDIAKDFAELKKDDIVYDLYTGTGSIACYIAGDCKKVIGLEYVPEAIEDAISNATLNNIDNASFYAGDIKDLLTESFFAEHGKPDVIITDPPRVGMHADVIAQILIAAPGRIVYVSCNASTQARDLALLDEKYKVMKVQPVDMFPHTSHVENVVVLSHK